MNYFSYIMSRNRIAAMDGGIMPSRETLAEHREHCEASSPANCPFEQKAKKVDEADLVSPEGGGGQSNAVNSSKEPLTPSAKSVILSAFEGQKDKPLLRQSDLKKVDLRTTGSLAASTGAEPFNGSASSSLFFIPANLQIEFPDTDDTRKFIKRSYFNKKLNFIRSFCKKYNGKDETINTTGEKVSINSLFSKEVNGSKNTFYYATRDFSSFRVKCRILTAVLPLIQGAYDKRHEDTDSHHDGNSFFAGGVDHYQSDIALENADGTVSAYTVELVCPVNAEGVRHLYDIVNIRPYGQPYEPKKNQIQATVVQSLDSWLNAV